MGTGARMGDGTGEDMGERVNAGAAADAGARVRAGVRAFEDYSCHEFVAALGSAEPVPSGGGAAALVGGVGVALASMAASLAKRRSARSQAEELAASCTRLAALQERLLRCIDDDAQAFLPLSAVYKMPKATPAQRSAREEAMEGRLRACAEVPLSMMRACAEVVGELSALLEPAGLLLASDVGSAAVMCHAAMQSAALSVRANTRMMKDRDAAHALEAEADALLDAAHEAAHELYLQTKARLAA